MIRHLAALAAVTWDLTIYGPRGGPATAHHHTYRWLTSTRHGRAALGTVWAGLHLAASGNLALLAIRIRRGELIGGIR